MNSEGSSYPGQQYKGAENAGSIDNVPSDSNEDYICPYTGEEFSAEFYRDRFGLRRLPVPPDVDNRLPSRFGFDSNQNYQLAYEDLARVSGLRRMDSDTNSDFSDFAPTTGYVAEYENRVYPNNLNRFQLERGGIGQPSGQFSEEIYSDQFSPGPNALPFYVAESPQSFLPYQTSFSDPSFYKKIKFLCSFGGRILPRPNDGKLRYVSGETRIISITKNITWEQLMEKTSAICNHPHIIKYQLPGEDLDALISVCSDEDLYHMIEEYEELERIGGSQRLRIFLISSNESESPKSIEARVNQPGEVDYQYVAAVNNMVDPSPRKGSSGQSFASQTSLLGNTPEYSSPRVFKESPTSGFSWDMKDRSPRSPHIGGLFSKRGPQVLAALQVPVKSFNQSPPSPMSHICVQPKDTKNSNVELFMDQTCNAGNESLFPFVMERVQCDNSLYREDANYVDPFAYCNNLAQVPPLRNYHHGNQHTVEPDQPKNVNNNIQFHMRSHSEDFVSSTTSSHINAMFERPKRTNEGSYHFNKSVSHCEGMSLVSNNRDREASNCRLLHAISDPLLQRSDRSFEDHMQPSFGVKGKISPSQKISSSYREKPLLQEEIIEGKDQVAKSQILSSFGMTNSCKGILDPGQEKLFHADNSNAFSDEIVRYYERSTQVTPHTNVLDFKDLEYINGQPGACLSSPELQSSECNLSTSSSYLESTRNLGEQLHGLQLDTTGADFFMRSQTSIIYHQFAMPETKNSQQFPLDSSDSQLIETQTDLASILQDSVSIFLWEFVNSR